MLLAVLRDQSQSHVLHRPRTVAAARHALRPRSRPSRIAPRRRSTSTIRFVPSPAFRLSPRFRRGQAKSSTSSSLPCRDNRRTSSTVGPITGAAPARRPWIVWREHHVDDSLGRGLADGDRAHRPAVAEHRDHVGHLRQLLQAVGNVDHGRSPPSQAPHQLQQPIDLVVRQGRSRFVQQQHAGRETTSPWQSPPTAAGPCPSGLPWRERPGRCPDRRESSGPGDRRSANR